MSTILEQWKTMVQSADNVSTRRLSMNSIYIAVNVFLIGMITFMDGSTTLISWLGIIVCVGWILQLRNCKILNTGKFSIINEWEADSTNDLVPCFSEEWTRIVKDGYISSSNIEAVIPIGIILLYIVSLFF